MKTYTCTTFTGHYPVGVAAVVRALTPRTAASRLNRELIRGGLPGDAKTEDMVELEDDETVRILADGNY